MRILSKKITICLLLLFVVFLSTLVLLPKVKTEAAGQRFIYINEKSHHIYVLEGDPQNPSKAKVVMGAVPYAGPREYFRKNEDQNKNIVYCETPPTNHTSTYNCPNYKVQNSLYREDKNQLYYITKRDLPTRNGIPFSNPVSTFENEVCNDTEPMIMTYALQLGFNDVNIHSYNECTGFNPNKSQVDEWGNRLPAREYTHGCLALSLKDARKIWDHAYTGMPVKVGRVPYWNYKTNQTTPSQKVTSKNNTPVNKNKKKTVTPTPKKVTQKPVAIPTDDKNQKTNLSTDIANRCIQNFNKPKFDSYLRSHPEIKGFEMYELNSTRRQRFVNILNDEYGSFYPNTYSYDKIKGDIANMNDLQPIGASDPQLWLGWKICRPIY